MTRISVFLDGANFYFMQKKLGWYIDPKKLLDYIEKSIEDDGKISDATYYIGKDSPPEQAQKGFLSALPAMGYSVVTKPIKTFYDSDDGSEKKKANLDIEIVLDMFNSIESYDIAVLISGDGDFERALIQLKNRGKRVYVIATEGMVAQDLKNVVGRYYIDFKNIKSEIEKC